MATSGTTSFTTTRDEIIRDAALEVSAIGLGVTMSAAMTQDFARVLNAMIKHWQGRGLHIWTVREATLFPVAGQARYAVGTGSTDHVAESVARTTINADEAAGQSILSVTSTTGMAAGYQIGIKLDGGVMHWTTVVSTGAGTVTVTAALPSIASLGSLVFCYASNIPKPVRIVDARRQDITSRIETPIQIVSTQEYRWLPDKANAGSINQMQYEIQRAAGTINLWSVPSTLSELLTFTYWRPVEIFTAGGDNPDLPEEWAKTLKWNLALELMGRYPVSPDRQQFISSMAASSLFDMEGFSREDTSVFFQPVYRR